MEIETFDDMKQIDERGTEYWSARDIMNFLKYNNWSYFKKIVNKAKTEVNDINHYDGIIELMAPFVKNEKEQAISKLKETIKKENHFIYIKNKSEDYKLSMYACYFTLMNLDPNRIGRVMDGRRDFFFKIFFENISEYIKKD